MDDVTELTIVLPATLGRAIDESVARGEYVDAGDYVRDLIRQRLADDDQVRAALEHGERSGRSPRSVRDIIAAERSADAACFMPRPDPRSRPDHPSR